MSQEKEYYLIKLEYFAGADMVNILFIDKDNHQKLTNFVNFLAFVGDTKPKYIFNNKKTYTESEIISFFNNPLFEESHSAATDTFRVIILYGMLNIDDIVGDQFEKSRKRKDTKDDDKLINELLDNLENKISDIKFADWNEICTKATVIFEA